MMTIRKLPAISACFALVVFAAALFFPALFGGKILAPLDITTTLLAPWGEASTGAKPHNHNPSDAVSQYLPYRIFAEESFNKDGYIGWNPNEMGGYSLAANTMALPGSWAMQLHRFLAFKDAWNLSIFVEFLVAGCGMLTFLRSRKLPWLPCLIGAAAFMFNAQFIVWIYHRWALGSFCWMPWVLWSLGSGFAVKPIQRRTLLLPGFLALALLGGSLQHMAFVLLACGCMAAGNFDFRRPLKNTSSVLGWSLVFLLAFGIAGFSLLPQINGYLSSVAIDPIRGRIGYKEGMTQPFFNVLLIPARIWPWLAGDPQTLDGWRLLKSAFMELNYLGTIPMLLGFAGLFHKNMPPQAKWLIAVGIIIPLSPLVGPLYHRVELIFILGGAWMAAEMLAILPEAPAAQRWQRWWMGAVGALSAVLLIATCIPSSLRSKMENQVVAKALGKSDDSQFGTDKNWIASRAYEWTKRFSLIHPHTAWVYGLLCIGTAGLTLATSRQPARARAGHLMILGATALELTTFFQTWTTFSDPSDLHPGNAAIDTVRTLAGPYRVLQSATDSGFAAIFATPNLLAAQSIPSVDAYESIQYRSSLIATRGIAEDIRLSLAGVGLAIQPAGLIQPGTESWPLAGTMGTYTLRKNPSVPAPITAGSGSAPASPAEIIAALPDSFAVQPTLQTPNRWAFDVPAGSAWVRIAQNWHEGWRWKSPGQDWKSFRNGSDAACWIDTLPDATRHFDVQFFPRPRWLSFASFGAVLVWLCLITILFRRICGRGEAVHALPL